MDSYFFRFRLRGLVQPGWIFSNVRRQRASFSVMDSTVVPANSVAMACNSCIHALPLG